MTQQNAGSLNSMKGFFSARGQGIRSNGAASGQFEKPGGVGSGVQQTAASNDFSGKANQAIHPQRGN